MKESIVQLLEVKAQEIEALVQHSFIDSNDLVFSCIHDETLLPWTENDFSDTDDYIEVPDFAAWEVMNYENSGMTTGAYLASQSYRWRVTGKVQAMEQATRAFRGLLHIYRMGAENEEGYFPKLYGGRISGEISSDQYLYAIKGMMAYLAVACPGDIALISRMIPKMVDFWVKRSYRYDYFALKDMQWPLGRFPSLLLAAYVVSGEEHYRKEAERLNEEYKVYFQPTESQILVRANVSAPFTPDEQRLGNKYLGLHIAECAAMDIMELDECLQYSDTYRDAWLSSMRLAWREGCLSLTQNGLARAWTLYDPRNGETSSPEPGFSCETPGLGWSFEVWQSGFLVPRSTMLARVGVHVAKWLPATEAGSTVSRILADIAPLQMRQCVDPDGLQILPQHRFMCHQFDADALTNWLWAYWQGRYEGVIEA